MNYVHRFIYCLTYPLRMLLETPSRLMAGSRRVLGISMAARVAILAWLLLITCAAISILVFLWMTPDRSPIDVKLNFNFYLVVFILIMVIPLVVYKAVQLWLEGDVSRFPDIDRAWKAGLAELKANGMDLTDIPLFLVLGSADEKQGKSLFGAAKLDLGMEGTPEGPAALHWYGNADGIFLVVNDASCLGKLSALAQNAAGRPSPAVAQSAAQQSSGGIRGTIVAGQENVAADENAPGVPNSGTSSRDTSIPETSASPPTPNIRGTMEIFPSGAANSEAAPAAAGASDQRMAVALDQGDKVEQTERFAYVCRLIRRARQNLCPINGLVTLLPFGLIQRSPRDSRELQKSVQADLTVVRRVLQIRCPVTAMVVGMESESGFRELVRRVGRERAAGQRFGRGFPILCPPTPERLGALSAHLCGAFEDWTYALFREPGALSKPGNTRLYALLCKIRRNVQARLGTLLTAGFAGEPEAGLENEPLLFGGCYFAATGQTADRQAFVHGVLDKLPEQQEELQWNREAMADDDKLQRLAQIGLAFDTLLFATLVGLAVYYYLFLK